MSTRAARRIPTAYASGAPAWSLVNDPGDYIGPVPDANGVPTVWFLLPCARDETVDPGLRSVICVCSPPHVFRECDDGSLEIRESIGVYTRDGQPFAWHGYLDEGNVWRQV